MYRPVQYRYSYFTGTVPVPVFYLFVVKYGETNSCILTTTSFYIPDKRIDRNPQLNTVKAVLTMVFVTIHSFLNI